VAGGEGGIGIAGCTLGKFLRSGSIGVEAFLGGFEALVRFAQQVRRGEFACAQPRARSGREESSRGILGV
jgi:hypothetical protein